LTRPGVGPGVLKAMLWAAPVGALMWCCIFYVACEAFGSSISSRSIMLVGDSITFGVVAGGTRRDSWARLLDESVTPLGYEVRNYGVPGTDALEWSHDLHWATPLYEWPDIRDIDDGSRVVVVALGTNDALAYSTLPRGVPHSALEYGTAMDSILSDLLRRQPDRRVLVQAPTHIPWLEADDANAWIRVYQQWCRDRAEKRKRVRCIVAELDASDYELGDVHPNAAGHRAIYESVLAALEGWL
jgi:lysophospholipase L1-like esterase